MSFQPLHGRAWPRLGMLIAPFAALMLLSAAPAAADAGIRRMSFAADPLTEALGARPVMPLDVRHAARWTDVLARQEASLARPEACDDADPERCFSAFWERTLADLRPLPRAEQVRRVNDLINGLAYSSDRDVYGQADYWATPAEMFAQGGGDCEDFALFKYFLLRALGVPAEDLRVTLVAFADQPHMVSLVMVDGAPMVLDCVVLEALPPEQLRQYQAVYSMGENGAWLLAAADPPHTTLAAR
jgi:predicted transglutaminase-like cysteine proteinase